MVGHRGSERERRRLFDDLYAETFSEVLAYCRRRSPSAEDANDAVAEVYIVAWRKIDEVAAAEKPIAWLLSVARGILSNQGRGRGRRNKLLDKVGREPVRLGIDPAEETQHDALVAQVFESLKRLTPLDQEIVALATFEGLSHIEIGEVVGKRPSVIKTRLYRARQRLREELAAGDETSGASSLGGEQSTQSTRGTQ